MIFTVSYGAYLPNAIDRGFSSVKIKQLRRFGRFYLLLVSKSKTSPKRMQLSLIVGIAFGFWLISDLPTSGWSWFPHFRFFVLPGINISGLRVNLHLTLQNRLNRRFRVRSIGKSGFRFSKSGFRISNRTRNPKTDFNAKISVFGFSFLPFDWEIRKRIWKTVLKNSGLARARIISKKKAAVHENSFANPFSDFPIER